MQRTQQPPAPSTPAEQAPDGATATQSPADSGPDGTPDGAPDGARDGAPDGAPADASHRAGRAGATLWWWHPWMTMATAGLLYLVVGFVLWIHAWADGATTHTLCGCGDPALFLWFLQWPATALAHGHNPFFSTALFHPGGINLLSQTSVEGISLPLVPVTWIWGPVATLNVASTLVPAISAFTAFVVVRRWAPWTPAAFVAGLLYGFSPFVLTSLEFAHLMTAALMLLPLILGVLDEILIRQRRSPILMGVLLGVLVFLQFFLSSELLLVAAITVVVCLVVLVATALLTDRTELRRRTPHAAAGVGVGLGVGVVLLAWPVWFALDGPAHLSGLVWPAVPIIGGFVPSSFVSAAYPHGRDDLFIAIGGYEGPQLGSAGYLGWSFLAVLAVGAAAFWRDRRLWFFGFLLAFCVYCSLGVRRGQSWVPAQVFARLPVVENVIQQRFMAIGFLAAAVMLAIILDRVHGLLPDWRGALGALVVTAVALVPMGVAFGDRLPFAMRPVIVPQWYTTAAAKVPAGQVLLSYPAPFSGIQSAMAWQAIDDMHYSQAGGGGPQGVASRAGKAAPGFGVLTALTFGLGAPVPTGTQKEYAAVRRALAEWKVDKVVVSTDTGAPQLQQGHDPTYMAAFMTGTLGRLPRVESGAWVWDGVQQDLRDSGLRPLHTKPGVLEDCVAKAEGRSGRIVASLRAPDCVGLQALALQGNGAGK